jgi:hypothetical protein
VEGGALVMAESVYVFLADDHTKPPLSEGIVGELYPIAHQFVTLHQDLVPHWRARARTIAAVTGRTVRVVRFTRAEVLEEFHGGGNGGSG